MNEHDGVRLMQYVDGTLPAAERQAVEAWISVDPAARQLVADHRALWTLLGEADSASAPIASAEFRRRTLQRANELAPSAWKPRVVALLAASLLVSVIVFAWQDAASRSAVDAEDLVVVGNLDLLEHLSYLDDQSETLDALVFAAVLHEFPAAAVAAPASEPAEGSR